MKSLDQVFLKAYAKQTNALTELPAPPDAAPEANAPSPDAAAKPSGTEPPETELPETESPETELPETELPETESPETESPETESPETESPETESPETESPETELPETELPQTELPQTELPQTAPNGMVDRAASGAVEPHVVAEYRRMDGAHTVDQGATRAPHISFSLPDAQPPDAPSEISHCTDQKHAVAISMLQMAPPPESAAAESELPSDPEGVDEFSPDWELDRFAWPDLCERLLTAEHRYFQHVGAQLKAATDQSHHVVMISGCRRGEGRTTLALCLARSAAAAGVDVAVVDADWENPQLGTRLGLEPPCGWTEVLAGDATLSEAAVTSVEDRLTLFPLSAPGLLCNVSKRRRPHHVMRAISSRFPLVIIDAGPWDDEEPLTETDDRDCLVDAAIIVRDLRRTEQEEAFQTARSLQSKGITAVGIAENFEAK